MVATGYGHADGCRGLHICTRPPDALGSDQTMSTLILVAGAPVRDAGPMTSRPTGTVTFLFTDVEGSTRLWENHPGEMRDALARHDEIVRSAIENHGGYVFSTAGDAFAAAFDGASDAVTAAINAQRGLETEPWPEATRVRVRMGLHTGEAQERDGDYFGPTLNRAARIMSAGHGGQILLGSSTSAATLSVDLADLGEHRLKDLSDPERLSQVRIEGLQMDFASLRTVDSVPGNLPIQSSSFIGRDAEVQELTAVVENNRLVTLTGVGGVGKTRLAVQVAAELASDFLDGVWLVELAPVSDPAAVPAAVAAALGVSTQSDRPLTESIAAALSGRDLLIVLDNCEHVLDATAALVEVLLTRAESVKVMGTSREGLQVDAEQLWAVPGLETTAGAESAAVELFVERAQAVNPDFRLGDDVEAVAEICHRIDGIALGIELAAARMVSMTPGDVRDRLGDRFRLLSGSRRGLDRHQTLRRTVEWSYDLLDEQEQDLLNRCSVFADGFDAQAATAVCVDGVDEFMVLDLLDALVRKSLVTTERVSGHVRYGLLETIRQFAQDQLAEADALDQARQRHAHFFVQQVMAYFEVWDGPNQRQALDWVDIELANLRVAFRWAADSDDVAAATTLASHAAMLGWMLQNYEPVTWAEEIIERATSADVAHLPRLYTAASLCMFTGRPEAALAYAMAATTLAQQDGHEAFGADYTRNLEGLANAFNGQIERWIEICTDLTLQPELAHAGLSALAWALPIAGRHEDARAIADQALASAHANGGTFWVSWALAAYGRSLAAKDPMRALEASRDATNYARDKKLPFMEALIARETAALEAVHGQREEGLAMYDATLDSLHRAGAITHLMITLANMVVFFDRFGYSEIAATLLGISSHHQATANMALELSDAEEHLRSDLGQSHFDRCVTTGTAMDAGQGVRYARRQIGELRKSYHGQPAQTVPEARARN